MLVGTMMAFDKHMNLVLGEAVEVRRIHKDAVEKDEKRVLGLVVLRGENVVSLAVDGPPPVDKNKFRKPPQTAGGPGQGVPAGRGLPPPSMMAAPQAGLTGPVRGVGGPGMAQMAPQQFGGPPPGFGGPRPMMPGFGGPPPGFGGPPPGFGGPPPGFGGPPGMGKK
jgi:small nuclear ribonucleoprotein B and B'